MLSEFVNPTSLPWEQPEVPVCLPIGSSPKKKQTDRGERLRRARLDPVLARVWGGSCNAAREQQNQPLCTRVSWGLTVLLPSDVVGGSRRRGMNPVSLSLSTLPVNQDWSGGTDYLCKNNTKGVSTSPPLCFNSSSIHRYCLLARFK